MKLRKSLGAVIAVGLTTACLGTPTAGAQTLAATCPDGPNPGGFAGVANDRWAQTFTPALSGPLTAAQLVVNESNPAFTGDFTVRIATVDAGVPSNNVLASTVVPESTIPEQETTITAVFASPATVVAGQQYALVLTRPGDYTVRGRALDPCNGQGYYSADQTAVFSPTGTIDLLYSVFVSSPPEPPVEPEPQPQAARADGTLTIDASKGKVKKGRNVTLSGRYDVTANETCERSREIELQRRLKSDSDAAFKTFRVVVTDDAGNYSAKQRVRKTWVFRALVQENASCVGELSNAQKVRAKKKSARREA